MQKKREYENYFSTLIFLRILEIIDLQEFFF